MYPGKLWERVKKYWQDPRYEHLVFHARKLEFYIEGREKPLSNFKEGNNKIKCVSFFWRLEWRETMAVGHGNGCDAYKVIRAKIMMS